MPVTDMPFHLYLNAFQNNRSTFMKESGNRSDSSLLKEENQGWCRVTRIAIRDGADLTPTMAFLQPDDGNPDDRTVMRVLLPEPVRPGERLTLDLEFTTKFPR